MIKNKISILVVDDEFDICEMVAEILKDENYNAIIANNYDMAVDNHLLPVALAGLNKL